MKQISPKELWQVVSPGTQTCLSIYINKKTDLTTALEEIRRVSETEMTQDQLNHLIAPIEDFYTLVDGPIAEDRPMGIFVTNNFSGYCSLPFNTKVIATVAKSFHFKPLIKWMQQDRSYLVVHFEEKMIMLYEANLSSFKLQETFETSSIKNNIKKQTFEKINELIEKKHKRGELPLILVGSQANCNAYKKISSYKFLIEEFFYEKNDYSLAKIHQRTKTILAGYFSKIDNQNIKKYWIEKARDKTTSNLDEIVQYSLKGMIKNIFINENMNLWGKINYHTARCEFYKSQKDTEDDDILDDLAEIVLLHGGSVTVLPAHKMPDSLAAAAIIRNYSREQETRMGL